MTEEEMNKLAAKILKAELMGRTVSIFNIIFVTILVCSNNYP